MKPRTLLTISLAVLIGWLIIVLYVSGDAIQAMSTALGSVEPESYLPLVNKQMTPTPTPTPTPTVTPTLAPIYVMDNDTSFAHSTGGYSVVGEVRNNTADNIWNIEVGAKFYKYGQSQPVKTISQTLWFVYRLEPGGKTCFALDTWSGSIGDWDYYVFDQVTALRSPIPPASMTIVGDVTVSTTSVSYKLTGYVRNDNHGPVVNARAQGTLYDKNGKVLDCRWANTLPKDLADGQTAFLDVDFSARADGYSAVRSYRVETQADYQ